MHASVCPRQGVPPWALSQNTRCVCGRASCAFTRQESKPSGPAVVVTDNTIDTILHRTCRRAYGRNLFDLWWRARGGRAARCGCRTGLLTRVAEGGLPSQTDRLGKIRWRWPAKGGRCSNVVQWTVPAGCPMIWVQTNATRCFLVCCGNVSNNLGSLGHTLSTILGLSNAVSKATSGLFKAIVALLKTVFRP